MPTITNVEKVKLNVMNKTQYANATKNPNELYAVTDADVLPDQTGNSGKFLTTDGTDASWSDKPLVNTATGSDSLTILGDATAASTALNIGPYSTAEGTNSLAIGPGTGDAHRVRATHANAIAIGYDALALAIDAIQLGTGQETTQGRFKVWNHTMLDKTTGLIPIARLGDDTSTTQGNVLTLDSNGAAVWQAPSGGGHEVIAFQAPTAGNNYTWYRKYADGWVEQGGVIYSGGTGSVTLPVTMAAATYQILGGVKNPNMAASDYAVFGFLTGNKTVTGFDYRTTYNNGASTGLSSEDYYWEVKGMSA